MPAEPILRVSHVCKRFGGLTVTDDVSFDVERGSRTALIGPNGAGKTTLFNLISGVYPINSGSIALEGGVIDALPSRKRISAGLSRSFQNIRLMPHLSVIENVMLGQHSQASGIVDLLAPVSWQRHGRWRRMAEERLREAGLDVDPDGSVSGLPYGVRKKIEVVRALMSNPRLLMLDEPAAGLNPRETADLSAFLKGIAAGGVTLLVVEHDMSFVHDLCERTVVLNFGRLIYDGPTRGVQEDEAVREAYLGSRRVETGSAGRAA
ncbi:ABC transporter ATP-binding protein [uncultured Alsobacter sp.]|uniref:ABC transporter ATP-binding protein n=1 Tax=uncultured Alsobacter sp. TaxID=1748258 RepID=UPI0025CD0289|nr:ABC transporter ATP-binding protein [uncultured Alsobacter sp.]